MSSLSITANGSSPTRSRACKTAWPRPERFLLSHITDARHLGNRAHRFQLFLLAALLQKFFQLKRNIEVIFNRSLAATGDDDDRLNSGGDRFFDHVLNQRLVDQRQHLFRRGFGGGQKTRAQAGGRKNCFANSLWHNELFSYHIIKD